MRYLTENHKSQPHGGARPEVRVIIKIIIIQPLGTTNDSQNYSTIQSLLGYFSPDQSGGQTDRHIRIAINQSKPQAWLTTGRIQIKKRRLCFLRADKCRNASLSSSNTLTSSLFYSWWVRKLMFDTRFTSVYLLLSDMQALTPSRRVHPAHKRPTISLYCAPHNPTPSPHWKGNADPLYRLSPCHFENDTQDKLISRRRFSWQDIALSLWATKSLT